jgi:hypothetical protein
MAERTQAPGDERTPLLAGASEPEQGADNQNGGHHNGETDFSQLNQQVNTWKRRRWISFIASGFLIVGFVVILVLSGGQFHSHMQSMCNMSRNIRAI